MCNCSFLPGDVSEMSETFKCLFNPLKTSGAYIYDKRKDYEVPKGTAPHDYTGTMVIYYHGALSLNLTIRFKQLHNS